MENCVEVDIAIIGGGLQALHLLGELVDRNYRVVLLARDALGGGQTAHSHAFLHNGHIFRIPLRNHAANGRELWREWLTKRGLEFCERPFYLGRCSAFEDRRFKPLRDDDCGRFPSSLKHIDPKAMCFRGIYEAWEGSGVCLNAHDAVKFLSQCYSHHIGAFAGVPTFAQRSDFLDVRVNDTSNRPICVRASAVVCAAASGNRELLKLAGFTEPESEPWQQQVAAYMLAVRSPRLDEFAGQFFPTLKGEHGIFIASRREKENVIWLISNGYREDDPKAAQTSQVRAWLVELLPHLETIFPSFANRHDLDWSAYPAMKAEGYMVNPLGTVPQPIGRANARQRLRMPPEDVIFPLETSRVSAVWPTLLTLIPKATERLLQRLGELENSAALVRRGSALPGQWGDWAVPPGIAPPQWQAEGFENWAEFQATWSL